MRKQPSRTVSAQHYLMTPAYRCMALQTRKACSMRTLFDRRTHRSLTSDCRIGPPQGAARKNGGGDGEATASLGCRRVWRRELLAGREKKAPRVRNLDRGRSEPNQKASAGASATSAPPWNG